MHTQRACPSSTNRPTLSLLLGALLLLAATSPVLAASGGAQPMIETPQMQQGTSQIQGVLPGSAATTNSPEPALATPALSTALPAVSQDALFSTSSLYNPCYNFDDPVNECWYVWSPSTFCCLTPNPRCPDICF